jgi:tetratricopeptide (TPR) repeat protein
VRKPILLNKVAMVGISAIFAIFTMSFGSARSVGYAAATKGAPSEEMTRGASADQITKSAPSDDMTKGASADEMTKHPSADEMTKNAILLFASNNFPEAIELENQAIKSAPKYWLPHSALSIFEWQRNRYEIAVKEAQEAAKLAPDNATATLNYAEMNQQLGYYEVAIPAFRKAIKVSPYNWSPRIGLMQSLIASSRAAEAMSVLDQMNSSTDANFDWWYQLSNSYSKLEKPKQASEAAQRAFDVAGSVGQKNKAICRLFVELIRSNQIEPARAIEDAVFQSSPKDDDVYVSALSAFCPDGSPSAGHTLIAAAIENVLSNAEGYYKIGEVCEQKANSQSESIMRDAWLDNAESSYRAAMKNAPTSAKYFLALAGVLDRKGRTEEMVAMLSKAKTFDATDPLAPYLVSRVKLASNDLAGRLREKLSGAAEKPYQLNLAKEEFQVDELHCDCRLASLQLQLKQEEGIKFVAFTNREKPFKGTLFVDQSFGSMQAFANIGKHESITLHVISSQPIITVSEAIRIAQNLSALGQPRNIWSFVPDSPKMPVI